MIALPDFSSIRLLCLGDLILDFFVRGHVERLSPEAPTLILRPDQKKPMLGGTGNVARNLIALGAHVHLITVVGKDEGQQEAEELLNALSPQLHFELVVDASRKTTKKTRFISGNHHLLRVDFEDDHPLAPELETQILAHFKKHLPEAHLVLLSDYKKGFFSKSLTQGLIHLAKVHKKPVLVDPKGRHYDLYAGADLLTPNAHELQEVTGLPTKTDQDIEHAGQVLCQQLSLNALLITRGKQGMSFMRSGEDTCHIPTQAQEVFDVSGAGDTVVAALGAALARDIPLKEAAIIANHAAGIAVAKMGTAAVSYQELFNSLHQAMLSPKIISLSQAVEKVRRWKTIGKRIGFTNGCFDLLHPGHLHTFAEAKKRCDHLVVGLNTDASIRDLKGSGRPIQTEDLRAEVLASLPSVDAVILFDSPTPLELIQAIKPDLLVKGGDYRVEQLSGAPFVQSYGGEIFLVPLLAGHSTSHTVKHFLNSSKNSPPYKPSLVAPLLKNC